MGRKAIPVDIQVASGTRISKERIKERREMEKKLRGNSDKIFPPEWLDSVALEQWERLTRELNELDLLSNCDVDALAVYCDAYSKYLDANNKLKQEGMFVEYTNKSGATNTIEHPAVRVMLKYQDVMRKLSIEFGLTPSARAKLAMKKSEDEPVNKFLKYVK